MEQQTAQSSDNFSKVLHLTEIYSCTPETLENVHMPRFQELSSRFEKMYGAKPKFIARAPGRVNLIGEHIDYSGYGVLPMALEQDTIIACLPTNEEGIEVNHILPTLFPPQKLPVDPYQKIKDEKSYINYFLAGYKAALIESGLTEFSGAKMLISGNLPQQAGLSSSASFVVCSGMAALAVNNLAEKTNKKKFIESAIKYERMIGTACGGMDQTISVLGIKGSALYIEFDPIRSTIVKIPPGYCFVVANSLTPSPKLLTLGTRYNKRVVECRFAVAMLLKELQVNKPEIRNLKQLQDFLNYSFEDMTHLVEQHIKKEPYTIKDLEAVFGESGVMKVISDIPYADVVLNSNHEFFVFQRATHVFSEAGRVIQFRDLCNTSEIDPAEKAKKLGQLMNESQYSCRDLYDCSSDELEKLTTLCRKLGAFGSRLTGAGWGGCCVSLVKQDESEKFVQDIMSQFYLNKENNLAITDDLNMYVFASYPGSGAVVLDPQYELWY